MRSPNSQWEADSMRQIDAAACNQFMIDNLDQPNYCTYFGCGRVLSITEQLYGNRCHDHSIVENIDINLIIKHNK